MTNTITYPAAYHVLSCDEMTYTEGGVGVVQAVMAWFPLYGWYKAVSTIHDAGCSFWFAASCVSIIGLVPNALIIFGS